MDWFSADLHQDWWPASSSTYWRLTVSRTWFAHTLNCLKRHCNPCVNSCVCVKRMSQICFVRSPSQIPQLPPHLQGTRTFGCRSAASHLRHFGCLGPTLQYCWNLDAYLNIYEYLQKDCLFRTASYISYKAGLLYGTTKGPSGRFRSSACLEIAAGHLGGLDGLFHLRSGGRHVARESNSTTCPAEGIESHGIHRDVQPGIRSVIQQGCQM